MFSPTGGFLGRVPVGGGTPVALVFNCQMQPVALAVDATSVYWIDAASNSVMKLTPK